MKNKKVLCESCGENVCECKKDIKIYFCPNCKSHNVRYVFGITNVFGMIPKMSCLDCKYSAPSFPILITNKEQIEKSKEKLKDKLKKKKNVKKKSKTKKRVNKK